MPSSCIHNPFGYDRVLMMRFYRFESSIYETFNTPSSDLIPLPTGPRNVLTAAGLDRQECHWRFMDAIRSWLDVFFSLSPATYAGLSFSLWAQAVRSVMVLYRLFVSADFPSESVAVRHNCRYSACARSHCGPDEANLCRRVRRIPVRPILQDCSPHV